ncbi:MAG: hypothetical protein U0575_16135 [Phycisphaerales bacterium]
MPTTRTMAIVAAGLAFAASMPAAAQAIGSDDFESSTLGALPSCPWRDAGLLDPELPNPPDPSAIVEVVTGALGRSTNAMRTVDALAPSQGVYALVPVSSTYSLTAEIRVDRYSDNASGFTADWPMQIGVGKLDGTTDLAFTPQVGIYASSMSQGWRLYALGASYGSFLDLDLEVPATVGTWYRVRVDLVAATGVVRSRVWLGASDRLLVDRTDTVPGWAPSDGIFDRVMLIDGELSKGVTVSNLATVDNVVFEAAAPIPPGPLGDLNGDGIVDGADLGLLLANWSK